MFQGKGCSWPKGGKGAPLPTPFYLLLGAEIALFRGVR